MLSSRHSTWDWVLKSHHFNDGQVINLSRSNLLHFHFILLHFDKIALITVTNENKSSGHGRESRFTWSTHKLYMFETLKRNTVQKWLKPKTKVKTRQKTVLFSGIKHIWFSHFTVIATFLEICLHLSQIHSRRMCKELHIWKCHSNVQKIPCQSDNRDILKRASF